MLDREQYQALIKEEGRVWGEAEASLALKIRPDWHDMQRLPHNVLLHGRHINKLLALIKPGWRVLEVGCASGWLSLEMARRGAHVEGIDVAEAAIAVAQQYAQDHPPAGSVEYRVDDINYKKLEPGKYDLIVAQGVLHHLVELDSVINEFRAALRPSGILYVSDALDTPRSNALLAGAFMMLLPTHLSYRAKFSHLLRLRGNAVSHIQDSIEAKGLSPFEGYGRHQNPLALVRERFTITDYVNESALVGYLIAQLALPDNGIIAVGRVLQVLDRALVGLHLMPGLNYVLFATPPR